MTLVEKIITAGLIVLMAVSLSGLVMSIHIMVKEHREKVKHLKK